MVRLSRRAESTGADGVMIIPPFYSTPTDDEIVHHYRTVADAIGHPDHDLQQSRRRECRSAPALIARLAEIDNCRYVKESTLEVTRVRDIIRLCGDRMRRVRRHSGLRILRRRSGRLDRGRGQRCSRAAGATVRTCGGREERRHEARALYLRYLPLIEFVGGQAYVAGTKALLAHMGFAAGRPRPPRLPLSAGQDAAARDLVQRFELTFRRPAPSASPR